MSTRLIHKTYLYPLIYSIFIAIINRTESSHSESDESNMNMSEQGNAWFEIINMLHSTYTYLCSNILVNSYLLKVTPCTLHCGMENIS